MFFHLLWYDNSLFFWSKNCSYSKMWQVTKWKDWLRCLDNDTDKSKVVNMSVADQQHHRVMKIYLKFNNYDTRLVLNNWTDNQQNWHHKWITFEHSGRFLMAVCICDICVTSWERTLAMQQFWAPNKILTIPQSLYSPNFRLFNFWPFLTLTTGLNSCHFASVEEVKLQQLVSQPYQTWASKILLALEGLLK